MKRVEEGEGWGGVGWNRVGEGKGILACFEIVRLIHGNVSSVQMQEENVDYVTQLE